MTPGARPATEADTGWAPLCAESGSAGVQEPYAVEAPYSKASSPAAPSRSTLPSSVAEVALTEAVAGDGYVRSGLPVVAAPVAGAGFVSGTHGDAPAAPVAGVAAAAPTVSARTTPARTVNVT